MLPFVGFGTASPLRLAPEPTRPRRVVASRGLGGGGGHSVVLLSRFARKMKGLVNQAPSQLDPRWYTSGKMDFY